MDHIRQDDNVTNKRAQILSARARFTSFIIPLM